MNVLYETITKLCIKKGVSGSRACLDLGLSKSTLTDIKSGRKHSMSTASLQKFADYFGVTVGYLLGEGSSPDDPRPVTDTDLMYALFDGEATPEQLEEVKRFAAYVKARDGK